LLRLIGFSPKLPPLPLQLATAFGMRKKVNKALRNQHPKGAS
jgi:hypothetical protein